jgi:hypothetical protein
VSPVLEIVPIGSFTAANWIGAIAGARSAPAATFKNHSSKLKVAGSNPVFRSIQTTEPPGSHPSSPFARR